MKELIILFLILGICYFVFHKIGKFNKCYNVKNTFNTRCLTKKMKKDE